MGRLNAQRQAHKAGRACVGHGRNAPGISCRRADGACMPLPPRLLPLTPLHRSCANAWWAVAKLHDEHHPAPPELLIALDTALVAALAAPPGSKAAPNAQAVSSMWLGG